MVLLGMDKTRIVIVIVSTIFFFGFLLGPNVFVQAGYTGVTVLSYSSYVSSSGHFIVVGELQNTGNHVLGNASLDVVVSASDGSQFLSGTTIAYVHNFLPQQKAPFYIDFGKIDFDTIPDAITFNFNVSNHPPTNYIEYPGLSSIVTFNGIVNDVYVVSGSIINNGAETANDIKVVGTYYNNGGTVVAVGFITLKDPLVPKTSVNFTVTEFDAVPKLTTKISNYSLLVQTSTQQFNLPSSVSPTSSTESSGSSLLVYVGVSAVVIVAVTFVGFSFSKKNQRI
jgi:hypothetical protein